MGIARSHRLLALAVALVEFACEKLIVVGSTESV